MKARHLDAKGKGEHSYDYRNDMLLFKIRNRDYQKSIDFDNIIIDIDTEGFITGIRVFDASKVFNLSKLALSKIQQFEFNARAEDKVISVQLRFTSVLRNKPIIKQGQDFVREAVGSNINDSEVLCSVSE
jgi:uncharacterized protein YuzE